MRRVRGPSRAGSRMPGSRTAARRRSVERRSDGVGGGAWSGFSRGRPAIRVSHAGRSAVVVTASAHWGAKRADLVAMVPPAFPNPQCLVTLTGIFEIAGAIGLLVPRTSRLAAGALALLFVAMFPANIYAARQNLSIAGRPVTEIRLRTGVQVVLVAAAVALAVERRRATKGSAGFTARGRRCLQCVIPRRISGGHAAERGGRSVAAAGRTRRDSTSSPRRAR